MQSCKWVTFSDGSMDRGSRSINIILLYAVTIKSIEFRIRLVHICGHLNKLDLGLQGKEKSVVELRSSVKSFEMQLDVFKQDLESEMMHLSMTGNMKGPHQNTSHSLRKSKWNLGCYLVSFKLWTR